MLTRINKHRDEAGFTLIELLVVVIIIGILAAIAIPVFLNQRNSARNASVQQDLRTVATSLETYYTEKLTYPANEGAAGWTDPATSPNNGLAVAYDGNGGYVITGCNTEAKQTYTYKSASGGLQAGTASGCELTVGVALPAAG